MPFKSEAQRRFMWANKPRMAKKWENHTPENKKLPEKVSSVDRLKASSLFQQLKKASLVDPASMAASSENDERRKEDLHQIDVDFEQSKKDLELQKMELDIEKSKMEFALKMQEMQQKAQDQSMQRQQGLLGQQANTGMLSTGGISDVDYKTNLSQLGAKAAAYEDQYIHGYNNKVPFEGKLKPMAIGAGLGILGSQLVPTKAARSLWDQASELPKSNLNKNLLRSKGLGANLKRTGVGAGLGLLTGLLAHEYLD